MLKLEEQQHYLFTILFIYVSFTIDHGMEFEEESADENRRTNMERGVEARRTTAEDKGQRHRNITCFVS